MLNMRWVLSMAACLFLIQPLSGRSVDDYSLRFFAVAMVALSVVHRARYEIAKARGGVLFHSFDRGQSWLSVLPLPDTLLHMIVEPALCFYLGWRVAGAFSPWLGAWLMIAAGMLWFTEFYDYRHAYHRAHDVLDGDIEARRHGETLRARREAAERQAPSWPGRRGFRRWFRG